MNMNLIKCIKNVPNTKHYGMLIEQKKIDEIINLLLEDKDNMESNIYSSLKINKGHMVMMKWLDNFEESVKDFGYINSFKSAGDILVDNARDVLADKMVFPIMFCYMQYIELLLKNILASIGNEIPYIHDMIKLWKKTKEALNKKNALQPEIILILDSIIKALFKLNKNSMDFRYRKDKDGNETVSNDFKIDLSVVRIWIDIFDTILYETYAL